MHQVISRSLLSTVLAMAATTVSGQERAPEGFGISDINYHFVSAEEFRHEDSNYSYDIDGFWYDPAGTPGGARDHFAPMRLPTGALVTGFTVVYEDSDPADYIEVALTRSWVGLLGTTGTTTIGPSFLSTGTPGIDQAWIDIDPDATITYFSQVNASVQSYALRLYLGESDDIRFRGVIVHWKRQISPAPAVATFDDVPLGAFGFKHVEALAASGITAGCDATHFCPNQPITRVQMAVFLAKALGLHWAP